MTPQETIERIKGLRERMDGLAVEHGYHERDDYLALQRQVDDLADSMAIHLNLPTDETAKHIGAEGEASASFRPKLPPRR